MMSKAPKSRRSFRAFPSLASNNSQYLYFHMFVEDVYQLILPVRASRQGCSAVITGSSDDRNKAIPTLKFLASAYRETDADIVFGAIRSVAQHLAWFGEASYELVHNETTTLEPFLPHNVLKVPGLYLQIVPRQDRAFYKRRVVLLPSKDVWRIGMPRELGGSRSYQKIINGLRDVSSAGPAFFVSDLQVGKRDTHFDFKEYNRFKMSYIALLTRTWGWNRRDLGSDLGTEFLSSYRTLVFRRSQAILREHIINCLNRLLLRLHLQSKIETSGLTSSQEIDGLIRDVCSGKIHYADALRKIDRY